jgi:hypothetical protein
LYGLSAAAYALIIANMTQRKKNKRWRNRRWWTKPWILRRDEGHNIHDLVHNELRDEDSVSRTTCECTHQHLKNFCSW